ncbi:hypothetical protein BASA50_001406 [Batrachochytrium salamandrivorans]|uniref:Uncharacterized protein n=1 Tax=Batrachochytrium salamandrivorans TaxID=1357716 RepID=A0ABQ8EV48_9FUNG|nr:hypothetical protein BASA50_001406 [Batrachochytrium salamandrivorans]KAH6602284.1 hypothetical protein BASA61_001269 [Batrachochytrium salamandrivorans]
MHISSLSRSGTSSTYSWCTASGSSSLPTQHNPHSAKHDESTSSSVSTTIYSSTSASAHASLNATTTASLSAPSAYVSMPQLTLARGVQAVPGPGSVALSNFDHAGMELLAYIRRYLARGKNKPEFAVGCEQSDDSLHRYTLVRNIRKLIDDFVGPILDDHLKSHKLPVAFQDLVASILDKITVSPEYNTLVHCIIEDAKHNAAYLLEHITNRTVLEETYRRIPQRQDSSLSAHSSVTCESSSLGSISSGVFPSVDEFKHMSSYLHPSHSFEIRFAAVQRLSSFSIGDMISDEFWLDSRHSLELGLRDTDTRISLICIRIIARAFKTAPLYMIPEVYLCFVSHLVHMFENFPQRKIYLGLDIREPQVEIILKKFRLLNQFMNEIPSMWLRFSESTYKSVMSLTFRLLSFPKKWNVSITALHLLSITDPHALWFTKWTLSHLGRTHITEAMHLSGCIADYSNAFVSYAVFLSTSGNQQYAIHENELFVEDVDQSNKGDSGYMIAQADLDYVCFLHVTVMLSRLALSAAGRLHFPVAINLSPALFESPLAQFLIVSNEIEIPASPEKFELSLKSFILILIRQMSSNAKLSGTKEHISGDDDIGELNMPRFMSRILKSMVLAHFQYREELYKDDFLKELLKPIKLALKGRISTNDEVSLLEIADILSDIAATDTGRKFILRGQANIHSQCYNSMSALLGNFPNETLDTIATLVKQSLNNRDASNQFRVSRRVLSSYIFFLRQFYRSCEGLLWLQSYELHISLATIRSDLVNNESNSTWNFVLIDNLLSFAATPKGVMLLQQTGSMEPCVAYMFHRYQRKQKVSKCEKFGYGTLVSQVSTTSPGMEALCKTGLVNSFIQEIWVLLSCNRQFGAPHMDIDDHNALKTVSNVSKVLTSFVALSTCLRLERVQLNSRDTLSYLIRKLVLVNEQVDDDWLASFEDSHQIGLRILRLITSSLDSLILLESTFHFLDSLRMLQEDSHIQTVDRRETLIFVVDENSLLRNYILIMSLSIGGAGERCPPETTLSTNKCSANNPTIPIMDSTVVPLEVLPPLDKDAYLDDTGSANSNLNELILSTRDLSGDHSFDVWIGKVQDAVVSCISLNRTGSVPFPLCQRLFSALVSVLPMCSNSTLSEMGWNSLELFTSACTTREDLLGDNSAYKLGVTMSANYASRLLFQETDSIVFNIDALYAAISREFYVSGLSPSTLKEFTGFDWFISTLYIMTNGDAHSVRVFLSFFSARLLSYFMWPRRIINCGTVPGILGLHSELVGSTSCHLVEFILEDELPMISSAFLLSGCTPTQMCQRWFREYFWGILPFSEISNFVMICLVFGVDYQVYFAIALIRHNQDRILTAARDQTLINLMNNGELIGAGFRSSANMDYIHEIRGRHRNLVLTEMKHACGIDC